MGVKKRKGSSYFPERRVYDAMKQRCNNPKNKQFPDYGGRGITVCQRWDKSYQAFLKDMGRRPEGFTLERLDNNLGYSPENCAWVDKIAQANNKRNNQLVTYQGITKSLTRWAIDLGLKQSTVSQRFYCYKWNALEALELKEREV